MNLSNYRRLEKLQEKLKSGLNLLNLSRLNPIFSEPDIQLPPNPSNKPYTNLPDVLWVSYPNLVLGERSINAISDPNIKIEECRWIVFDNVVVYFPHEVEGNISKLHIKYSRIKDAPFYIQALVKPVTKIFKISAVVITDELPFSITMMIYRNPDKQRKDVLNYIAKSLGCYEAQEVETQEAKAKEVFAIINDERISFKEALDKINSFIGVGVERNFSYCLACGDRIDLGKKFCNTEGKGYNTKNNCLNIFNYWLKARLKIKTAKGRDKKRVEFHKELQALTTTNPLSAFDIFKSKCSKLYTKRYKERWIREKNQS